MADAPPPVKLLCSGDVRGVVSLRALEERVAALNASHGPFAALVATGVDAEALAELAARTGGGEAEPRPFPVPLHFVRARVEGAAAAPPADADAHLALAPGSAGAAAVRATCHGSFGVSVIAGLRLAFMETAPPGDGAALSSIASLGDAAGLGGGGVFDVLVTNDWPAGALLGLPAAALPPPIAALTYHGSDVIARAAQAAQPRYHIAGGRGAASFFARAPYTNRGAGARRVSPITRMVSLAPAMPRPGEGAPPAAPDAKFLHALALVPAASLSPAVLAEVPPGVTASPYASGGSGGGGKGGEDGGGPAKRARLQEAPGGGLSVERAAQLTADAAAAAATGGQQFFWTLRGGGARQGGRGSGPRGGAGGNGNPDGSGGAAVSVRSGPPPECWFCLASPDVAKHLVVSIGDEAYIALPKGGVADDHTLIIPINHTPSLATAPPDTREEVTRTLAALRRFYASRGCGYAAFERVLHRGGRADLPQHTHLQVVGLPWAVAATAGSTFIAEGQYKSVAFETLSPDAYLGDIVADGRGGGGALPPGHTGTIEYLYVEVSSRAEAEAALASKAGGGVGAGGGGEEAAAAAPPPPMRLLHRVPPGVRHPLQFGREVLCRLLSAPERIQWKACALDAEAESAQAAALREAYKPFDEFA